MTLSRPRTTGRVLRGSALGLGLLVAGGAAAPAAFAVVDTTGTPTEVPVESTDDPVALQDVSDDDVPQAARPMTADFGLGKDFTVQVAPQTYYPSDLDLSGARFVATPVESSEASPLELADDAPATYTCTTDQWGTCTFTTNTPGEPMFGGLFRFPFFLGYTPGVPVPNGTYTLTQESTSPGLAANTGSTTFSICSPTDADVEESWEAGHYTSELCPAEATGTVEVDSLFRTSVVTTVVDQDTEAPIAGAGYTMTAPDYPHRSLEPIFFDPTRVVALAGDEDTDVVDDGTVPYQEEISDEDGRLTFGDGATTWFLPGPGYTLTPTATVPQGYAASDPYAFAVSTTAAQSAVRAPLALTRVLGTGLAPGAPAPAPAPAPGQSGGVAAGSNAPAGSAATTADVGTAPSTAPTAPSTSAALAVTGSPVGTMVLVGGGLLVAGGSALVAGSTLRRRARRSA